jgi:hypothetical protein
MSGLRKFTNYTRAEANEVAQTFVAEARQVKPTAADTELWTEWVLDWFADAASTEVVVDARGSRCAGASVGRQYVLSRTDFHAGWAVTRTTGGEFLVDLCHTTFPKYEGDWGSRAYWERAFVNPKQPPTIQLALESEFGSSTSEELNLHRVMEDASKLLVLRARVKVMVFASVHRDNRQKILALARQIAGHDRGRETTWVWIDLPWGDAWTGERTPERWVFPTAPQT